MLTRKDIHIIAEAGTNHNGQLAKAKNLAQIAKTAGADSVKFQIINPWGLYLPGKYEYGHYDIAEVIKIRKEGQMTDEEYTELNEYCETTGIPFSASVFDLEGLNLLTGFNPPYIKIASCDLNHISFLEEVAAKGLKTIISTGMSTLAEVEKTVQLLSRIHFEDYVLLHCVSIYPAKLNETHLSRIEQLRKTFGCEVGFSDHTGDSTASCIALSLGATWFEKHFTEDKSQRGLDHAYAQDPEQLKKYIHDLTMTLESLNDASSHLSDGENYTKKRARRSLYASRPLAKGHIVQKDDILIVRPENVMQADEYTLLVGQKLNQAIEQHQPFDLKYLEKRNIRLS